MSEEQDNKTDATTKFPDIDNTIDEVFYRLRLATCGIAAIRDGIWSAQSKDNLEAWQEISAISLENYVNELNAVMKEIADNFEGIEFFPVKIHAVKFLSETPMLT